MSETAPSALLSALSWVDVAIFAEVQRMRARGRALGKDAPWGAYIGEAEVDEILGDLLDIGPFRLDAHLASGLREVVDRRRAEVLRARRLEEAQLARSGASAGTPAEAAPGAPAAPGAAIAPASALLRLALAFGLDDADLDLLLLALAPEVNARYLRLFAYLQDDLSAQHLTPALALRLLADDRASRLRLQARFGPEAPLLRHRLLQVQTPADGSPLPLGARPLSVVPRVARWLLHGERWDSELGPFCRLEPAPEAGRAAVAELVDAMLEGLPPEQGAPVVRLRARSRRDALEAARHLAARRAAPLLVAELSWAARLGEPVDLLAGPLARESRLQGAALLLLDPPEPEPFGPDPLAPFVVETDGAPLPLLIHAPEHGGADALPTARRSIVLPLPGLSLSERTAAWEAALIGVKTSHLTLGTPGGAPAARPPLDPAALARRFRFSAGQIAQVLDAARDRAVALGHREPGAADVVAACADAFVPEPGPLAERVLVRRAWDDLVLPDDARTLLRELVSQVERREQVLEALGEDRVRAGERGIKALFSGPPGTGKSLAAEVIAHALGYPLFRVDLSSVVSKWVGETEKHLSRLFVAAEDAPCVLLFDEADALFGRRAEVKGAQDRFANLEVSYLLQRLETFDGIAILTTNLKRNIDEAFLRRFTFVVDFPFPEADERRRIWERVLTPRYPLADDVKLPEVASEFRLSGANIWNVAVAAACAAAESPGARITRAMLAHAVGREYQKLGREVSALRPSMLAGGTREEEPSTPGEAGRKKRPSQERPLSAAEARRRRLAEDQEAGVPQGSPQGGQD